MIIYHVTYTKEMVVSMHQSSEARIEGEEEVDFRKTVTTCRRFT